MKKNPKRSRTSRKAEQTPQTGHQDSRDRAHDRAVGVQGPNTGYWQAVGSTRSAAKRSKRP
jgi:hypothetical protein